MGITVHGIIEVFREKSEHSPEHWEDVATVEFNKDWRLNSAAREMVPGGWPRSEISDETRRWYEERHGAYDSLAICDFAQFRLVAALIPDFGDMRDYPDKMAWPQVDAAIAFMEALEKRGEKTRILLWTC